MMGSSTIVESDLTFLTSGMGDEHKRRSKWLAGLQGLPFRAPEGTGKFTLKQKHFTHELPIIYEYVQTAARVIEDTPEDSLMVQPLFRGRVQSPHVAPGQWNGFLKIREMLGQRPVG